MSSVDFTCLVDECLSFVVLVHDHMEIGIEVNGDKDA